MHVMCCFFLSLCVCCCFSGGVQTYVGETLAAVEAHSLESAVTQHLDDLGILLAVLLEGQLSALVIVLLGSSSAVLAALLCAKKKESC